MAFKVDGSDEASTKAFDLLVVLSKIRWRYDEEDKESRFSFGSCKVSCKVQEQCNRPKLRGESEVASTLCWQLEKSYETRGVLGGWRGSARSERPATLKSRHL